MSYLKSDVTSIPVNTTNMSKKLFLPLWILGSLLLFLYSFTQVDLSLTLSKASIFQTIEKGFQYVGWFNRPVSTYLYIAVFAFLFFLYLWTIKLISQKKLNRKTVWLGIFIVTGILTLSYNAFSYDLFNYVFDAKIVTFYHQNPYIHKALDFPNDPMLSFMRWTHRVYPYGPVWLGLTVPLSFIGGNIFIVTVYLFKIMIASFFLLTVWSLERIGKTLKFENVLLPVVAFAFNPFVLSESLVSAHNDIVMMGLAIYATSLLMDKRTVKGSVIYLLSVGLKFATAFSFAGYTLLLLLKKTKYVIEASMILSIVAVIVASMRTNFQPWYLLYVIPFAVLRLEKRYVRYPLYLFSVASVIYYVPFLYSGNWNDPIPMILNSIVIGVTVLSIVVALVFFPHSKKETN